MDSRHTLLIVGLPGDVGPLVKGLREQAPNRVIEEASSYEEATSVVLAWRARLEAGDTRGPDLVVVDMDEARVQAPKLIRLIRATIDHKVAIVVLAPGGDPTFVRDCFRLNANAVVERPEDPERMRDVAASIARYWLRLNTPAPSKPALQAVRDT